jgi:ssDNA-binding Zn-finger/Zn-ribbon topoisomerase 1
MQNIAARLAQIKENPQVTKGEHVQGILKTQYEIANNICPRCGKPLVLRNGKNGQFYGCSGYPDCRFTKNF